MNLNLSSLHCKSKILTRVVLLGRLNILGEDELGNMTREICGGEIYIVMLFCYCYQLLFQPRTPLLQPKPPPNFQTVNINQGLCDIFS